MGKLKLERIGGLTGLGGPRSRIRSCGECDLAALSAEDQQAVEALFSTSAAPAAAGADRFRVRLSRVTAAGQQVVVVPEEAVPAKLLAYLREELL